MVSYLILRGINFELSLLIFVAYFIIFQAVRKLNEAKKLESRAHYNFGKEK